MTVIVDLDEGISYYSCKTILTQIQQLKTTCILFNATNSVGQESLHGFPRFSAIGHYLKDTIQVSAGFHLNCESIVFQVHMVVGRSQFLTGS